jgi:PilZ domain
MDSRNAQPAVAALTERDRRLHPRYTVQVQIELRLEGNEVPMRLATTDLSRAGCYIELMMPLPVGTHMQATLWLDGHPIVIRRRVIPGNPQYGNGMMFEKFEGQAEQFLQQYQDAIVTTT